MTIKRIKCGSRMSQAVVHGGVVSTAGQVALKAAGEDAGKQTTAILTAIDGLLTAAGTDKSNLLTANIWLADMSDFAAMNEVWDRWIDPDNPPVRAGLCSALAAPHFLVEIMVMAAK